MKTAVEWLVKQVGLDHTDVWKKEIEKAIRKYFLFKINQNNTTMKPIKDNL